MADDDRPLIGVFEPRDVDALTGAYRAILDEISEAGALSSLSMSNVSARDIRRIAAREVIGVASRGTRDRADLIRRSLARIAVIGEQQRR